MGRGSSGDAGSSCPMLRSLSPSWLPARPSRWLGPISEQGCNFAGTHACPPSASPAVRQGGQEGKGWRLLRREGMQSRAAARTGSEPRICVWPGSWRSVNPANPPRHFYQEGPLGAGSSPLAASPPGKRNPALTGGKYLRRARSPHAGCQRPGTGPGWVRRDGVGTRCVPAANPAGLGAGGTGRGGDPRSSHVPSRIVHPSGCRGAWETGIPSPCQGTSYLAREDGTGGGLKTPTPQAPTPTVPVPQFPPIATPARLPWQGSVRCGMPR